MGDDSGLTHHDLAAAAGVSVTTIKSYRSKFPGCFPVLRSGKPLRFAAQARDACLAIREGFGQGLSVEELRERLRLRFPWSWRRPRPAQPAISASLEKTVQDLARSVVRLTQAQTAIERRLQRLEHSEPDNDAVQALRRDLDALRAATPSPEAPKIIRIRTSQGDYQRYALHQLPQEPHRPDPQTLSLPLTVRSDKGEFLGLAGPNGHLTVQTFQTLIARSLHTDPDHCAWTETSDHWQLHIPATSPHSFTIQQTTTPKGNTVALVTTMHIDTTPQDTTTLIALLRSLRRELSD